MYDKQLRKLGLNRNEAKVYLCLLQQGEQKAGSLSKRLQLHRRTVYDTLERLLDNGLVKFSLAANRRVFQPVDPEVILQHVQAQTKLATKLIPKLKTLRQQRGVTQECSIYKGRKGIKAVLNELLKCKEYSVFGSPGRFMETMKHDYVQFQNQKRRLQIKATIITNESSRNAQFVEIAAAKFRYLPDAEIGPSTTFIYNGSVAIMIWDETPIAIVIKSKAVHESYKRYFDALWKKAKP